MIPALIGALTAGLMGGPHCAGMCGGFVTACTARGGAVWPWHVGRLLTYVTLGGIAGGFGAFLPGPSWAVSLVAVALLVWFALRLGGLLPESHWQIPGLTALSTRLLGGEGVLPRVGFGALTGLMPCGLVYAALSLSVAVGSAQAGALAMAAFWLGTVPALSIAAAALRRVAASSPWARRGVAAGVLCAGLWSLGLREAGLVHASVDADVPPCHAPPSLEESP